MEHLVLCIENGCFKYNGGYYKQLFGIAMAKCLLVNVAGILINSVLDKMLGETGVKPILLVKYVYYIFGILASME